MAAEEDVGAALIAARRYIAGALAHLERLLLAHVTLKIYFFIRCACAVRCWSAHRVLLRVHQALLDRYVVWFALIHFEDGLLLRGYGQAEVDLRSDFGSGLLTRSILVGHFLILVDGDHAAVAEHVLGQFTLSDELQVGARASARALRVEVCRSPIAVQDRWTPLIVRAYYLPHACPALVIDALDDKIFEEVCFRGIFRQRQCLGHRRWRLLGLLVVGIGRL